MVVFSSCLVIGVTIEVLLYFRSSLTIFPCFVGVLNVDSRVIGNDSFAWPDLFGLLNPPRPPPRPSPRPPLPPAPRPGPPRMVIFFFFLLFFAPNGLPSFFFLRRSC